MKKILLKIITAVGVFFSAVFYVLFTQKKIENEKEKRKKVEIENEQNRAFSVRTEEAQQAVIKDKVRNEEKVQKAHSGNKLSNFNAVVELLQK